MSFPVNMGILLFPKPDNAVMAVTPAMVIKKKKKKTLLKSQRLPND